MIDIDTILLTWMEPCFHWTKIVSPKGTLSCLPNRAACVGYDVKAMAKSLQAGLLAMMNNDGSMTNKERFDSVFTSVTALRRSRDERTLSSLL